MFPDFEKVKNHCRNTTYVEDEEDQPPVTSKTCRHHVHLRELPQKVDLTPNLDAFSSGTPNFRPR